MALLRLLVAVVLDAPPCRVTQGLFEVLNFALLEYGLQVVLLFCGGGFGRSTNYCFGGSVGAPSADTKVIRFLAGIVGTPMA